MPEENVARVTVLYFVHQRYSIEREELEIADRMYEAEYMEIKQAQHSPGSLLGSGL
jgi:hypothetical protein